MATAGTPESVRAMARSATVGVESVVTAEPRQSRLGPGSDPALIRAWARTKGYEVGDRGRIPVQVIEAYDDAHGWYCSGLVSASIELDSISHTHPLRMT
jgi:hypothetical protein